MGGGCLLCAVMFSQISAPSLPKIRTSIENQLLHLETLNVSFSVEHPKPANIPQNIPFPDQVERWRWTQAGKSGRMTMGPQFFPETQTHRRIDVSVKGRVSTIAEYSLKQEGVVDRVIITDQDDHFGRMLSPAHFLGLRLWDSEDDLLSLLSNYDVQIVGEELVGNTNCLHLLVNGARLKSGTEIIWDLWLSPDHHYQPKKMSFNYLGSTPNGPRKIISTFTVYEYKEIPMESGGVVFFPVKAKRELLGRVWDILEVNEVNIGEKGGGGDLTIAIPDGTIVDRILNNREPESFLAGEDTAEQARKRIQVESQQAAHYVASSIDAKPVASSWFNVLAWCFTVVCVVCAAVVWLRSN